LYHEFVHAVTDALARLNRHEKVGPQEPRALQVWQAAAMDEGFADYFACSLAVRKQAPDAFFYAPPAIEDADDAEQAGAVPAGIAEDQPQQQLKWPAANIRKLGGRREDGDGYPALEYDLSCDSARQAIQDGSPIQVDEMIYQWAEQWGRYLWALRTKLGAEVADTLIAHSLFFMTRWSTFESGVLAIALAERLIFGGMKDDQILEDVQSACYWKFASEYQPPAQPADTRPAEETADMPRRRPRVNKSQPA